MNELRQTVMAILYGLLIPWRKFWRKFLLKRSVPQTRTHIHTANVVSARRYAFFSYK